MYGAVLTVQIAIAPVDSACILRSKYFMSEINLANIPRDHFHPKKYMYIYFISTV